VLKGEINWISLGFRKMAASSNSSLEIIDFD
jgi:hypothetical protein